MDDACAVCGTALFDKGDACAVIAGVAYWVCVGAAGLAGAVADECVLFTATGAWAGCVVAIGALFATELLPLFAISFAIATSVPCMPVSVFCTAVSCDGVSVELETTKVLICVSVAASVFNVALNALTWLAESLVVATVTTGVRAALGVPASAGVAIPFCISKLTKVAWAT